MNVKKHSHQSYTSLSVSYMYPWMLRNTPVSHTLVCHTCMKVGEHSHQCLHTLALCVSAHPNSVCVCTSQLCVCLHIPTLCVSAHPNCVCVCTSQHCVCLHIPTLCVSTHLYIVYVCTSQLCVCLHIPTLCVYTSQLSVCLHILTLCVSTHPNTVCVFTSEHCVCVYTSQHRVCVYTSQLCVCVCLQTTSSWTLPPSWTSCMITPWWKIVRRSWRQRWSRTTDLAVATSVLQISDRSWPAWERGWAEMRVRWGHLRCHWPGWWWWCFSSGSCHV